MISRRKFCSWLLCLGLAIVIRPRRKSDDAVLLLGRDVLTLGGDALTLGGSWSLYLPLIMGD